jgi:putative transcriptional regulator
MYHYKESGLDDVVLLNGYTIRQTPYGETVSIENVDALHRLLARQIILQREINGAQFRFLRREMGKTQAQVATWFQVTEQSISLWERDRDKAIPPLASILLRLLYAEHIGLKPKTSTWLKRVARIADRTEKRSSAIAVRLSRAHHWKTAEGRAEARAG